MANPLVHPSGPLGGKPISQMTDTEVLNYVAFVLESWAHLQGGLGALSERQLGAFVERLRAIGERPMEADRE